MTRDRALQSSAPEAQQANRDHDRVRPVCELLRQVDVCALLGISDQTWMNWRKAGRTPEAVILPSGVRRWRREDIDRLAGKPEEPSGRRYFGGGQRHAAKSAASAAESHR